MLLMEGSFHSNYIYGILEETADGNIPHYLFKMFSVNLSPGGTVPINNTNMSRYSSNKLSSCRGA
jgi:hypothetical protein